MTRPNRLPSNAVNSLGLLVACVFVFGLGPTCLTWADDSVEQLIQQLQQPISNNRVDAASRLARLGMQASSSTDALIQCLGDTENDVRLIAAYALGCVQNDGPKVLAALVSLLDDRDEHVRYSAAWSIARISKGLGEVSTPEVRRELIVVLEQSVKALERREHQPRHKVAIEIALGKLVHKSREDSVAEKNHALDKVDVEPPASILPPVPIELPVAIESPAAINEPPAIANLVNELELAKSVYRANDKFGRFQFIKRISDAEKYPDRLRELVLEMEAQEVVTEQAEAYILRYAVSAWGPIGQRILAEMIQRIPTDRAVTPVEAQLILHAIPTTPELKERLLAWACDPNQDQVSRIAAIQALSEVRSFSEVQVDQITRLFSDEAADPEIRTAAADVLTKLGTAGATAEPFATALLMHAGSNDQSIGFWAMDVLTSVAPKSPTAAAVVLELLKRRPYTDPLYPNIVEACGKYGELSADSVPVLTALLTCEDHDIRGASARSLGQIGTAAHFAAKELVDRIVDKDEVISVKNRAAVALQQIGPTPLVEMLAPRIEDHSVLESILRSLAIVGHQALAAQDQCLAIAQDESRSSDIRSAAIHALGSMGPPARLALPALLKTCETSNDEQLIAACVLAAVRIDPVAAMPLVQKQVNSNAMIVRASAAFGLHLIGDSKTSFDKLIDLINGSDADSIIEQTIRDLGPITEPWLLDVANDVTANRFQRLACCLLAGSFPAPDWARLLPLAEDQELGEEFTFCLQSCWHEDAGAVDTLLNVLEIRQFTPVARARIASLLSPDGLGAGEDEEDWQGITLSKPSSTSGLLAADSSAERAMEVGEPGPDAETRTPEVVPSTQPALPSAAIQPVQPIRAQASSAASGVVGSPKVVDVFYGTNRSRDLHESSYHEFAIAVLATSAGCLCVMLFCLLGAVRSGNRAFAVVALIAIAIVGPLGFYASQKLSIHDIKAPVVYGKNYLDSVELGVCKVSIPPKHEPGMLESPNLFRMEIASDPQQHVVLTKVQQLSRDKFFEDLRSVESQKGKNLLVFIHGYNVSFEDAARRTAQMSVDLNFPGAPVFYSWPSQANWYGYAADSANIQLSVKHIRKFLEDLALKSGAESINLVAHSMGNVGLTEALKEIENKGDTPLFNQVVLAAPDIDADVFKNRIAPHIIAKAKNVTLYTSQTDLALVASRYFNHGLRIGDSGSGIPLFQGIDTIDATAVDSSLLGHSYYGSNITVLTDLGRLLENQPIDRRDYLRKFADGSTTYWAFDPLRVSQLQSTPPNR